MPPLRVLVVFGGVLLAGTAAAQDWKGDGRLSGRVLGSHGQAVPGASVRLDLEGRGGPHLRTDRQGRWAYLGLAAGTWGVSFEAAGHAPRQVSVEVPASGSGPLLETRLDVEVSDPEAARQALTAGDTAYAAGRFAEARAAYERLLELQPDLAAMLHLQIARCHKEEGQIAEELDHLEAVLRADPENASIRVLLAMEAIGQGFVDRGLEALVDLDPSRIDRPEVFYNLGLVFRQRDQPELALAQFTHALGLDPGFSDGYLQRGLTYLGLGLEAEARSDLDAVLRLSPEGAAAEQSRRALLQIEQGQRRDALSNGRGVVEPSSR
jgi:tetratricopeptide (TPR) repeat protein